MHLIISILLGIAGLVLAILGTFELQEAAKKHPIALFGLGVIDFLVGVTALSLSISGRLW